MDRDPLFYVIVALCFAVVVILAMGLGSFAKGGKSAGQRSNRFMQLRIIAQAAAVLLIALLVFMRGGN